MQYQVKSSSGFSLIPAESRWLAERRVFIEGEISQEGACEFMRKIMLLNREDPDAPIDVFLSSNGGSVSAGLYMYDVIQGSKAPIRMFCQDVAYSMGAVLLACGNHGRFLLPHSEVMLHQPLLGNHVGGNASSIKSISDSLMETKRKLNRILAKHTGRTEEEIEEATAYDHYFSPEECIAFGLADEIVGFDRYLEG